MKATGVVRRIDELGRIVIPKEIRKTLRIREGETLEIYTDNESEIILKKFSPIDKLNDYATKYVEAIQSVIKSNIIVTDRDKVVAASNSLKRSYLNQEISAYLEGIINNRETMCDKNTKELEIVKDEKIKGYFIIHCIIVDGDAVGSVIIFSEANKITEAEEQTAKIASLFFAKQLEQ